MHKDEAFEPFTWQFALIAFAENESLVYRTITFSMPLFAPAWLRVKTV